MIGGPSLDPTLLTSLASFAFVMSITPGPNNLLLMSSGALFGWRRTIPHVLGIQVGFASVVGAAVLGLGALIDSWPWLMMSVRFAGAAWLAWMAVSFARTAILGTRKPSGRPDEAISQPFRFHQAVLFQWVNPKGILMALSGAGVYSSIAESVWRRALIIGLVFALIGIVSSSSWLLLGGVLHRSMTSGRSARIINGGIALLIVSTAFYILLA